MSKRLRKALSTAIPPRSLTSVYNSYDIVGDIAIMRASADVQNHFQKVADVIMNVHNNVKTVLAQISGVNGDFRLRGLRFVAGEDRTTTVHKECGCLFSVDVRKCYFSPRLSYERMRIAKEVRKGDFVVNMFAGVGCFSILMAKKPDPRKVYSIDVNPCAFRYMQENIRLNRACARIVPLLGDAKSIVETSLRNVADRVLMPLPEKTFDYLPYALSALKKAGGVVHYYEFEHAGKKEEAVEKVVSRVSKRLEALNVACNVSFGRIVRTTGPHWYQVALDIQTSEPRRKQ